MSPLATDTVAIPVTKGVNLTSEDRLIEPPALLEATNARFSTGGGAKKRRGHKSVLLRNTTPIPPSVIVSDANWLFGWGIAVSDKRDASVQCGLSTHPNAGRLFGLAQRDRETVAWTGHSLLSYTPSESPLPRDVSASAGSAVLPSLSSSPVAKIASSQLCPDMADNGLVKVVAWIDPTDTFAHYSLYDSNSDAVIVHNAVLDTIQAYQVRTLSLGPFLHILLADANSNTLWSYTIHEEMPTSLPRRVSYGPCTSHFDVWKISEAGAGIAKSNGTVDISWMGPDGSPLNSPSYLNFSITPTGALDLVALATHPVTGRVEVAWQSGGSIYCRNYNTDGSTPTSAVTVTLSGSTTARRLSVAPKYLYDGIGNEVYDVYWDGANNVISKFRANLLAGIDVKYSRFNLVLASCAFRVGDRTFIWAAHPSSLQSTFFLVDEGLDPVGHQDFATAHTFSNGAGAGIEAGAGVSHLSSVNWYSDDATLPTPGGVLNVPVLVFGPPPPPPPPGSTPYIFTIANHINYHLALSYNVRVPSSSSTTSVFAEPSIKSTYLNFLPPFRVAQAGRALYIAGAQVWSYDGAELVESGFHIGPEVAAPSQTTGGSLTLLGTYFYRIDVCYKNAQGEEIRSLSILTTPTVLTGTNNKLTLTIPTCYTRRKNTYFLIFRNAMASGVPLTNLWLLSSRDPTSPNYVKNDQTVGSITFIDTGAINDTQIQKNELHPANAGDVYLQPIAAPACETISAGRDRVWVSGGELLPGQVSPSRLFDPGDTPSWNPYLAIQVDRSAEPITAIGFVGEVAVFFRRNSTYVMDGDGPDNVTNGAWAPSRLAFADLGATSQESLALISPGLMFQGPAGIRLMSPSGALAPVGVITDDFAKNFVVSKAVLVDSEQEVRWYGPNGTLVYNYLYDCWSTWTVEGAGAIRDFTSGLAVVAQANGYLFIEDNDTWNDGGAIFTHRIRFPWLHAGSLGDFQRVRSISGVGTWNPDDGPHKLRVEVYYDERHFWEEVFEWDVPNIRSGLPLALPFPLGYPDTDIWGANTWGDGVWGDSFSVGGGLSTDATWDWKRKLARQKCAVISIAIEDRGTDGPGFTLNALCLRLAKKPGLNRLPGVVGGSDTYRG